MENLQTSNNCINPTYNFINKLEQIWHQVHVHGSSVNDGCSKVFTLFDNIIFQIPILHVHKIDDIKPINKYTIFTLIKRKKRALKQPFTFKETPYAPTPLTWHFPKTKKVKVKVKLKVKGEEAVTWPSVG